MWNVRKTVVKVCSMSWPEQLGHVGWHSARGRTLKPLANSRRAGANTMGLEFCIQQLPNMQISFKAAGMNKAASECGRVETTGE